MAHYADFAQGFQTFRPCLSESRNVKEVNNQLVKLKEDQTRARSSTASPEQAMAFLDRLVDKMNRNESFNEYLNSDPTSEMTNAQYDESRMNMRLDLTLLEVIAAVQRGQPDPDRMRRYNTLVGKLKTIMKMRHCMFYYHRLQQGMYHPAGIYDDDAGRRDCARALIRILLNMRLANLHKRRNSVCAELEVDGKPSGYFKPQKTIRDYVYDSCSLQFDPELFDLLLTNINPIVTHLTEHNSLPEFPVVSPVRGWYSFRNGIYSAMDNRFWMYEDPAKPSLCTVHYIDETFVPTAEANWRDIRTPALMTILDRQQLPADIVEWVFILLGRLLYPVKAYDRWETTLYFQGVADSGKSTIVDGLFRYLYDQASTFIISNNMEELFGLQEAVGPSSPYMVCCGAEIGKNFKLDQKQFQQMCSGERVSVAVKNGKPVQEVWTLPMVMSGNQAPSYCDESGSIARRMAIIRFTVPLTTEQKDPQLLSKIGQEMPLILQKIGRAYKERVDNGDARRDFWKVAGPAFADSRAELKAATNPLEEFAQSGLLIYEPGSYMKVSDLREAGNISSKTSVDAFRDVFQARGVSFPAKKVRRLIPGQDRLCHTTWADGVRLATDNEME